MNRIASKCLLGALAGTAALHAQTGRDVGNPVVMVMILGAVSLAPFVAIMLTSFVKISVVLSLVRSAIGTQQVPPAQVTNGIAFILTLFVMTPVAQDMYRNAELGNSREPFSLESVNQLYQATNKAKEPLRRFLLQHAQARDRALFVSLGARLDESARVREGRAQEPPAQPRPQPQPSVPQAQPPAQPPAAQLPAAQPPAAQPPGPQPAAGQPPRPDEEFRVVIPAFVTSQLKEAFQVGFLVLLPFLVLDVVVANILIAMGINMLQPATVSLPFKILLFVLADGWYLIVKGLVLSYA